MIALRGTTTAMLCAIPRLGGAYSSSRRPVVSVRAEGEKADKAPAKPKLTKQALKDLVKASTNLSAGDTSRAVDAVLDTIMDAVAEGKEVVLPGFGSFKPRKREARTGRNPKTGEALSIAARVSPTFTAGKTFKDIVAGGGAPPAQ